MGIFEPYRAIGCITTSVPFSVQRLGTETFVTVSVGKAFQIFNVIPQPHPSFILSLFLFPISYSDSNVILIFSSFYF